MPREKLATTGVPITSGAFPPEARMAGGYPNVNVTEETVPGVDITMYRDMSLVNMPKLVPDAHLTTGPTDTQLGGEPAFSVGYEASQKGAPFAYREVSTIHKGRAYNFTLTATPNTLERTEPAFNTMTASWKWTD